MKELSIDFINTKWYGTHKDLQDHLLTEALFHRFLVSHEISPEKPLTPEERHRLISYRDFLEEAINQWINSKNISEQTLVKLHEVLEKTTYVHSTHREGDTVLLTLKPVKKDLNWILSEISASFIQLLSIDDGRLRRCENPDCGWFFYDETRNRSKKCCDETCSTLLKVRRFRANKKEEKALSQR